MKKQTAVLISLIITLTAFTPIILNHYWITPIITELTTNLNQHVTDTPSPIQDYNYVIYTQNGVYHAKNGITGHIDYSSTNSSWVYENAKNSMHHGGTIRFREGTYNVSTTYTIDKALLHIEGSGKHATTFTPTADIDVFTITSPTQNQVHHITLENFGIVDQYQQQTTHGGIYINNHQWGIDSITITNLYIEDTYQGIYTDQAPFTNWQSQVCPHSLIEHVELRNIRGASINMSNIIETQFIEVYIRHRRNTTSTIFTLNNDHALISAGLAFNRVTIIGDPTLTTGNTGIHLIRIRDSAIHNSGVDYTYGNGWQLTNCAGIVLERIWTGSSITGQGIVLDGVSTHNRICSSLSAANSGWGILETGDADYNMILNTIADTNGAGIYTVGNHTKVAFSYNGTTWIQ